MKWQKSCLDDLASLFGVARKLNESDNDLRKRIRYDVFGFDRPNGLIRAVYRLEDEDEKDEKEKN